ncbi:MAG: hypothetical protein K0Q97_2227 [Bacillota bacterium]|nr:hypothetical protein [Bacillota bacterium]
MRKLIDIINYMNIKYNKIFAYILILIMISLIGVFIYFTGGTTSFVHLMYIPILISVFLFGIREGIIFSFIAGLLLGPFMPMVVSNGIMQETGSWIFRIIMFIVIVLVVGTLVKLIKTFNESERKKAYQDTITGYPNANKLRHDLNYLVNEHIYNSLNFVVFDFINKEMISQYVDYHTSIKSYLTLLTSTEGFFHSLNILNIYVISKERFVIVIPDCSEIEVYNKVNEFTNITKQPIYINSLPVSIVIKSGIVSYPHHSSDLKDILLKLERVLNQPSKTQNNVIIYDNIVEEEKNEYYNALVSIYHSLQNDMFSLVYQPKVNLSDNKLNGVEALLRVNNVSNNLSISQLINIAEEVGFINEITKWVIINSIKQIKKWQDNGFCCIVAINLSSLDLKDDFILNYIKECLQIYDVDSSSIELELTERIIIEDKDEVMENLEKLKKEGIKISIDDYGSGYNSLNYLVNSKFKFDFLKIDKTIIDNITVEHCKLLCEGIIKSAHVLGMEVVAEGVERKEQVDILKIIGCDVIQGYYYSEPLHPDDLYISDFGIGTFAI